MIKVDRESVDKPKTLLKEKKEGTKTETEKAIDFHRPDVYDEKNSFTFSEYRSQDIKEALRKLFSDKCAYCESTFLNTYPGDIEHFRPKGEITEAVPKQKPGYYWLASDWDNLLFSCRNCNQKLSHHIFGSDDKKTMGKMNQFPLSDSSKHVRSHSDPAGIKAEEEYRLLLNPCNDFPEEHLEYGEEGTIRAKKNKNGELSQKGKTSIDVYVLQRVELVKSREKHLINIQAQIQRVNDVLEDLNDELESDNEARLQKLEKRLEREVKCLHDFLGKEEPYLGLARQEIGKFMESMDISIKEKFNV